MNYCSLGNRFFFMLQLAEAIGPEIVKEELIGAYVQLLKDNEAEVRTAAASQLPGEVPRDK